ncbi:MAG: O-antigen ligase family protein [Candidatus Daviesbacteria bacterium]|nr:O-antigen ligase family protein [Candidatus Daviesbacteria bacterium]
MQKFYLIFNKISFWAILILLVFIPLYPKFPLINVANTYVAIRIEDIFILLVLFIWFFGHYKKIKNYLSQTIFQSFLLFWIIGGLSLFSALFVTYFIFPNIAILHWFRRIEYMSLFIVAATSISNQNQVKLFTKVLFAVTLLVILYGFGQIWLDFPVISTTNKEFSKGLVLYLTNGARVNSTFAGHYDLAAYLSIALVILASTFFDSIQSWLAKFSIVITGFLGFILLGFTASRVSFVAALAGLSLVFWMSKKKILVVILCFLAIGLLAAIPDLRHRFVATLTVNLLGGGGEKYTPSTNQVNIFTPGLSEEQKVVLRKQALIDATSSVTRSIIAVDTVPGEPINSTELGVYRSFGIRFDVEWPRAINAFLKNPFLGTGYSSIAIATDNDILRSLGEVGILGTLALGLIFFILMKKMLVFIPKNHGFERQFIIGVFCTIVAMGINSTFIDVLEASKVAEIFWLILGVAWAVLNNYDQTN